MITKGTLTRDGVMFEVARGEVYSLIGAVASGSDTTPALNALADVLLARFTPGASAPRNHVPHADRPETWVISLNDAVC